MSSRPGVTFLFTDVQGSMRLLHELGAEAYAEALAEHRRAIREACAARGGFKVVTQGGRLPSSASRPALVASLLADLGFPCDNREDPPPRDIPEHWRMRACARRQPQTPVTSR
ncbi:MAG: Adenylate and Guanylate cyclase catalytic domain [Gaiellaceae bacterium]|nr:Adenylate and Guanylate cyclase catalytic domain [Gaiellaceae bacterium]